VLKSVLLVFVSVRVPKYVLSKRALFQNLASKLVESVVLDVEGSNVEGSNVVLSLVVCGVESLAESRAVVLWGRTGLCL
jgi:hypothetical protein